MATSKNLTNAEALQLYGAALENSEKNADIKEIMSQFGYDSDKIKEGKALLGETSTAFNEKDSETVQMHEAYKKFADKKQELIDLYSLHRKKAKVIFAEDAITEEKIGVNGTLSSVYAKWLVSVKKFYREVLENEEILNELIVLKVTKKEILLGGKLIEELESARANYLNEKGESESATKAKSKAFEKMDSWMSRFYAVAKIALEDQPQLMEALGKKA